MVARHPRLAALLRTVKRRQRAIGLQCNLLPLVMLCSPGTAAAVERYVSPGGGDIGTCSTAIGPCRSFDYAYHQAQPGDVVLVAGGEYPSQVLNHDPAKTSDTDVIFRPAPGAAASVGDLDFGKDYDDVGAAHVTVEGIEVRSWATFKRTVDVTLRNVRIHGAVFAAGARQLAFYGGEWGDPNVTNDGGHPEFKSYNRPGNVVKPDGLTLDGVLIHDIIRTNTSVHTNCFHPQDGANIVVRNSRFRHCDVFSMLVSPTGDTGAIENLTIENNVFEPSTNVRGAGTAYYSIMLAPNTPLQNVVIRNNTFGDPWIVNGTQNPVSGRVVGNLGELEHCPRGLAYSHNVWMGRSKCAPTDKTTENPGWTQTYDLAAGSPAIDAGDPNDYPPTDARGKRRFIGAAPDAGALEYGDAPPTTTNPTGREAPWIDIRQRGRVRASRRGRVRVRAQCVGPAGEVCRGRISLLRARKDRRGRRRVYATRRVALRVRSEPRKLTVKLRRRGRRSLRARRRIRIVAVATTPGVRRDQAKLTLRRRRG